MTYIAPIQKHLSRPRQIQSKKKGADEFTYVKTTVLSEAKRYGYRYGWKVLYKGEEIATVYTLKEVEEFIKEKLLT